MTHHKSMAHRLRADETVDHKFEYRTVVLKYNSTGEREVYQAGCSCGWRGGSWHARVGRARRMSWDVHMSGLDEVPF